MSPIDTLTNIPRARSEASRVAVLALTALVGIGLLWSLLSLSALPHFVDRVTVVNPTAYDVEVDVSDAHREGWMPISLSPHGGRVATEAVVDQGDRWTFRFVHAGLAPYETTVTRAQLRRDGWKVTVPTVFERRLATAGIPASP